MKCILNFVLTAVVFAIYLPLAAVADPIDGRDVLKFQQLPMLNTPIADPTNPNAIPLYHGHDELSTAWGFPTTAGGPPLVFQGRFMADDFADHFNSRVVHLKWWGSYLNRPTATPDASVRRFLISFEEDIPAPPTGGFSRPGEPILNQIVTRDLDNVFKAGEGTFTEKVIPRSAGIDGPTFEYNAELHLDKAFREKAETVYWLKIVALDEIANPNIPMTQRLQWGWHNRDYTIRDPYASTAPLVSPGERVVGVLPGLPDFPDTRIWHFQDDAVSGNVSVFINPNMPMMPRIEQGGFEPERYLPPFDGPSLIGQFSKDLAFNLYTTPEPGTLSLLALALCSCATMARRRR